MNWRTGQTEYELLSGHQRLLVQGVEGPVLSGGSVGKANAPLLRRAVSNRRNQQHFLSHAQGVGFRSLGEPGSGRFQVRAQGIATDYPYAAAQRFRRFAGVFT